MSILDSLADYECPRCGCSGVHACIGKRLPPPTPEEEAAMTKALEEIFKQVAEEEQQMFPGQALRCGYPWKPKGWK